MDKFFHSTFDFFSLSIPGTCIVIAFCLLDKDVVTFQHFIESNDGTKIGASLILLIIGYVVGFAVYPIGRYLYRTLGFKIWRMKVHNDVDLYISDKYILIRELSPNNFKYVETWNMFCAMAHNLAVASLIALVIIIFKVIFLSPGNIPFWVTLIFVFFFLFFLFLRRAVVFSIWAADDLNAAITTLKLQEQANNLAKENAKK